MSFRVFSVAITLLICSTVWAQDKTSGDDGFRTDYQPGQIVVPNKKSLETIKKVIIDRTAEFEKLYEKLSAVPIQTKLAEIQKGKDKIVLLNDFGGDQKEGNQVFNQIKYIEYIFEGGKVKSVNFYYDHENYYNNIYTKYKVLQISPSDVESATISVKYTDREEKTEYKDFNGEARFKTLKLLENNLLVTILKMDTLLRRNILEIDRRVGAGLKGL
ncbi:MAG: hypothetical protein H7A24_07695 [Leptospiraceae bacterium]|nr:hypothetical protein [Leptospiraceae bacterium]MCP5511748.1 hypothetical protein [Leptospiraceae bacterium]